MNGRSCHCPSKGGIILAEMAFLATMVTSGVTFHMWANTPQMRAFTPETLDPTLL